MLEISSIRLASIYANSVQDERNEKLYEMMAIRCVESLLYLGKLFNDIQMLKERTSDRYKTLFPKKYEEWKDYKSYLMNTSTGGKRFRLHGENQKKFIEKRPFRFDLNEFGYDNKEKDLEYKRSTYLWQDSGLRLQLIKAEYVILCYYKIQAFSLSLGNKFEFTERDKAFQVLCQLAMETAEKEEDKILASLGYIFDLCTIANIFMDLRQFNSSDMQTIPVGHCYSQMVNFAHPEELGYYTLHLDELTSKLMFNKKEPKIQEQIKTRILMGNQLTQFPKISFNEFSPLEYDPDIVFFDVYNPEHLKSFTNSINLNIMFNANAMTSQDGFKPGKENFLLICIKTHLKHEYDNFRTINGVFVQQYKRDIVKADDIFQFHHMTDPSTVSFNAIPYLVGRFSEGMGYEWIKRKPTDEQPVPHQSKPLSILHVVNKSKYENKKEFIPKANSLEKENYSKMKIEDINKDYINFPRFKRNKRKN